MRIIIIFLFFFVSISFGQNVVKYAAIIYRHGDRTPVDVYPNDPWKNESLWPVKFGQLTNIGKEQHYELGKWIKKRYSELISEKYDPSEIYVRSTDVDRTLMSAQANLAGMFPPTGDAIWDPKILWQPIPVHTRPEKDDELLAMKRYCPLYDREKEQYVHSKHYKKMLSKYQKLMDDLTVWTGKSITDFQDINDIYNDLYIESLYNFTLPEWTKSVYPDKMKAPACYSFATATATNTMSQVMSGPLLREIVEKMDTVITKKSNPLKLSMYSGHDFTIGNILSSIGVYDQNCPVYTATIIFELVQDSVTMKYFVQMWYRNSTKIVEPRLIVIPKCEPVCPYERFITLYKNFTTFDWDKKCGIKEQRIYGTVIIVALIVLIGVIVKINCSRATKHQPDKVFYSNLFNSKTVLEAPS